MERTWHRSRCLAAALVVLSVGEVGIAETADGPLTPEKAADSFRLEPGLRVELVAAEPLVVSPVAMAFNEQGWLYVAENRGYPTGPGKDKAPVGRIALLRDVNDDGRMDYRTDFAEGLTFPNGLLPWKGGLIVTCAPDVLYLRDTDGDGKADERRVLFTGFSTAGSTQLRVSNPTLSVDNWVYLTSGLTGGEVVSPSNPGHAAVSLKRTDFRFRPDGDAFEAADGGSQFGLTFDDAGHRFICYNRVQVQHVVIDSKTLRRNPQLAFSETVQDCPAETVAEPLKGHGAAARLFPISRNVTTADSHAGTFTAACAVTVFRGGGLPDPYLGGVFSCDPTGNLVHFDRLIPKGATFSAVRARDGIEFLASTDNWFRPVFLVHGPLGGLYVCDMYRKTIEHPDYLPAEIRKRTDFEGGKTMGRIWRVVDAAKPREPSLVSGKRGLYLSNASILVLCNMLRHPDGWWRDTAHRLLLEHHDPHAAQMLRWLAQPGTSNQGPLLGIMGPWSESASSVVHALHLLSAIDALPEGRLRLSLRHSEAPVRENALCLVEPLLAKNSAWLPDVLSSSVDKDARVRFQAAVTLGAFRGDDARIAEALAKIAARDGSDRWTRAAVFSALSGRELAFLDALRGANRETQPLPAELLTEFGRLLGASRPRETWPELVRLVIAGQPVFQPIEQAALLAGLAQAARGPLGKQGVLSVLAGKDQERVRDLVAAMSKLALDPTQFPDRRRTAIGLLAFADFDQAGEALTRLTDPGEPSAIQIAAVRALGAHRDGRVVSVLLSAPRFETYTPALRDEVLSALLSQPDHVPGLLSALEDGRIPVTAIDALRRRQLTGSAAPELRRRAEALFGAVRGDRAKVYDGLKEVIAGKSDPAHGRAVFRRECASCHRLDREGSAVGPDLFGVRNQPKEAILLHILVPDQEITPGFASYSVATRDGRVLTGLIASETPASLTLRQPLGKEDTLLRAEIDEVRAGKQSLMPQGFEKTVSRQEFADLLAYLKGEGEPDPGR